MKQFCEWKYVESRYSHSLRVIYCHHPKRLENCYGFAQICTGKLDINCPINPERKKSQEAK
jgi:hypothetical protein